jgi:DNA-binding transcriptional LysR family regulator
VASFGVELRRLVIGISHHIVGAELPLLLRRMHAAEPAVVMELRVSASSDALDAFDRGEIDAAIVLRHDNRRRGGEVVLKEPFGWMAVPDFQRHPGEPLRLATQAEPCSVRKMALKALKDAGIGWTEAFVGGGIMTIGAAISAGLAVAALGRRVAPADTVDVGARLGLPALPSRDVVLYSSLTDRQARSALRSMAAAIRATAN